MNRVINNPDLVVEDMLRGILAARPELRAAPENPRVVSHAHACQKDRVGIVTGGGSGHEPAFIGYVGRNLVDAVAVAAPARHSPLTPLPGGGVFLSTRHLTLLAIAAALMLGLVFAAGVLVGKFVL